MTQTLPIDRLCMDDDIQARQQLEYITVAEYAAAMQDGAEFPPVVAFFDGETYWLADGFHRITAAKEYARLTEFAVDVRPGGKREAQWFALGANQNYGVRRNAGDLKKIARRIFDDPEWHDKGQREIARHTGIPQATLSRWFAEFVSDSLNQIQRPSSVSTTRNGRTYTMDTANIGKGAPSEEKPLPARVDDAPEPVAMESPVQSESVLPAREDEEEAGEANAGHNCDAVGDEPATLSGHSVPRRHPASLQSTTPPVCIINGDAQRVAELVTAPVHLVVTSPPYNVGIAYDQHNDNLTTHLPMLLNVWRGCHAVMDDGARICVVVPFGVGRSPYVPFDCAIMQGLTDAGFTVRGRIIWDKNTTGNRTSWGSFRLPSNPALRDTTECIIVAHKGEGTLAIPETVRRRDGKGSHTDWLADADYFMELAQDHWVVAPESAQRVKHPAPFPVPLVERLIHFYGFPGCHVLDPFGGSGTTAVAAKGLGCRATLVELSAAYCALAQERCNERTEPDA